MNTLKRWSGVRTRGARSLIALNIHHRSLGSNRDILGYPNCPGRTRQSTRVPARDRNHCLPSGRLCPKRPRLAVGRPSSKEEQAMRAVGDSGSNAATVLREEATELGANVAGPVILPGDDEYAAECVGYNLNLVLEPEI